MLDAVRRIRAIVDRRHPPGHLPYKLEDIRAAIVEVTGIDFIRFNKYPDGADENLNPVRGRFRRYEGQYVPYSGNGTVVEIDYANSLNFCWTRFVVCKEICHSLEEDSTVQVSSFPEIERLIEALQSAHPVEISAAYRPFLSERTAQICALELLCPIRDRRRMIENGSAKKYSEMQIATAFRIPVDYIKTLFDPAYVGLISKILEP
ncbi:MAG TPA: hypothetical protein VFX06_07295 [Stellaceae bacterium]|nr:hypothetical protein [Stellaceae bacterium]